MLNMHLGIRDIASSVTVSIPLREVSLLQLRFLLPQYLQPQARSVDSRAPTHCGKHVSDPSSST
jgi:hypothetical protein